MRISQETSQAHTVPNIDGWVRLSSGLKFMQDNASGQVAKSTFEDLTE